MPDSIAASTAQPGSWSCLQSRKRQWSIRSNTSAKARSIPRPDNQRLTARTPGVSIIQPSPGSRSSWAATVVWRPRLSPSRTADVACTCAAEEEVDQRRLADPAGAEEGERAVAGRVRRDRVEPGTGATAGEQHGHAERHLDELGACRGRVVDEVGLGQHHHRLGSGVERQHELALEPALVGRRVEGVHEEHDVDVGGDRLGLEAGALERRPAHERRMAVDDVLDTFAV